MATERWLPVVGYEGYYEVSNIGRVRSLDRAYQTKTGKAAIWRGRILKHGLHDAGYPYVNLSVGNKQRVLKIHNLVLEAFVGPRPDGMVACHENDIPDDNRVENLRWDTHSSNGLDATRNGRSTNANKTSCKRGHPLVWPNLVSKLWLEKGWRSCLGCSRELSRASGQKRAFSADNADARVMEILGVKRV